MGGDERDVDERGEGREGVDRASEKKGKKVGGHNRVGGKRGGKKEKR